MKILATSDWHGDASMRGYSRFDEVRDAVWHTVQEAIERKVDVYAFLGDLTDPDSGSCVFRVMGLAIAVAEHLRLRGITSIWIAGNHDVMENGKHEHAETTLRPLVDLARISRSAPTGALIHVFEDPGELTIGATRFVLLPYTSTNNAYDAAKFCEQTVIGPGDIVLGHLMVPGVIPGEETNEMPRGRDVVFPLAETACASYRLNGHYHRPQAFDPRDGGPPILIPGSVARLTFGEERNEPSFLCFEV